MNNIAIRVNNLSKCYHIYDRPQDRLKQSIVPKLRSLVGRNPGRYFREFWALNDVSFEVARGETVGIIGRNGSGKSTLLQMICGTLEPNTGSVETNGRVAALLELGAGFNPEFTGRENVYMNASVLGLSHEEIHARFDEIVAFADIGDFIEQPVKYYSSGMYARLAFAVAINVDPSILVVDEALAVGDEPFQRKCFAKIEEIKRNGATILFVSHSSSAIIELCDRAILLYGGEQLFTGQPKKAVAWYQKLMNATQEQVLQIREDIIQLLDSQPSSDVLAKPETQPNKLKVNGVYVSDLDSKMETIKEDEVDENYNVSLISKSMVSYVPNGAEILNFRIETLGGRRVNNLIKGRRYRIYYEVKFNEQVENVRFYSIIKTIKGVELGGITYPKARSYGISVKENQTIQIFFEFDCNLWPDTYFFNCGVASDSVLLHRIIDAGVFRVTNSKDDSAIGVVDFGCFSSIRTKPSVSTSVGDIR